MLQSLSFLHCISYKPFTPFTQRVQISPHNDLIYQKKHFQSPWRISYPRSAIHQSTWLMSTPGPKSRMNRKFVKVTLAKRSKPGRPSRAEYELQEKSAAKSEKTIVIQRSGMNAAVVLSGELRDFFGTDMMIRRDAIAGISKYIREQNLTCEDNKRKFRLDETLKNTFKTDGEFLFLQINKLLRPLLRTPAQEGPDYEKRAQVMFDQYVESRGALTWKDKRIMRSQRGKKSAAVQKTFRKKGEGIFRDVVVDDDLAKICGRKRQMPRPEVMKRIWRYIKKHNLQDPSNGRVIKLDDKLGKAIGVNCETIDSFHLGKYVWKKVHTERPPDT